MKRIIILALSFSFVLVCATISLGATQWSVLVGIDKYQRGEISVLKGAANDAKGLSDMLKKDLRFPERNVLVYTSESSEALQPTTGNIVRGLRYVAEKARPEDTFIMFFAGHGVMSGGKSYLLTYQSDLGAVEYTALAVTELIQLIKGIKAKQQLLMLDACRNDPGTGRGDVPNRLTKDFVRSISIKPVFQGKTIPLEVSAILFSCEEGQRAYEWAEKNRGFFSYYLEKGIQGDAADAEGKVTLSSLVSFLQREVPDSVQKIIGVDKRQVPWVRMEGGDPGSWIINRLRGDKLEELKAKAEEKQKELDRLGFLEREALASKAKERDEFARYEANLRKLDAQIEEMKKRLGTEAVRSGDTLDAMVAMVRQKEEQEKKLEQLRKQQEQEQQRRETEIARLRKEKDDQTTATLQAEVVKYKEIVASKYGKDLQHEAWKSLISKCPTGWADGVEEGDTNQLILSSTDRLRTKKQAEEARLMEKEAQKEVERRKEIEKQEKKGKLIERLVGILKGWKASCVPSGYLMFQDNFLKRSLYSKIVVEKGCKEAIDRCNWRVSQVMIRKNEIYPALQRGVVDGIMILDFSRVAELKKEIPGVVVFKMQESKIDNPHIEVID